MWVEEEGKLKVSANSVARLSLGLSFQVSIQ